MRNKKYSRENLSRKNFMCCYCFSSKPPILSYSYKNYYDRTSDHPLFILHHEIFLKNPVIRYAASWYEHKITTVIQSYFSLAACARQLGQGNVETRKAGHKFLPESVDTFLFCQNMYITTFLFLCLKYLIWARYDVRFTRTYVISNQRFTISSGEFYYEIMTLWTALKNVTGFQSTQSKVERLNKHPYMSLKGDEIAIFKKSHGEVGARGYVP